MPAHPALAPVAASDAATVAPITAIAIAFRNPLANANVDATAAAIGDAKPKVIVLDTSLDSMV